MAAQPQQQQGDNSYAILWIVGILCLGFGLIWYLAQPQIVAFVIKLRLIEINIVKLFSTGLWATENSLKSIPPSTYNQVSFNQLVAISETVGRYLAYPAALILGSLSILTYINHATLKYKKTYSMQRLIDQEVTDWPQITPIEKVDLVKQHIDKGPWAMAMAPMQFAKKHNLLIEERSIAVANNVFDATPKVTATVSKGDAHRVFTLQLGPYWRGIERLPIYAQALFAAFAARANGDRNGSAGLLAQIASSTRRGKLDFSGTNELLAKYGNSKPVLKITASHAFVLTVMASMLSLARQDGVLPSADFLWLKPIDRRLWFMLNTVGRKTAVTEVAGAYAHWLAECQYARPIKIPMVDEAVNALELAITETLYKPDEEG